MNSTVTMATTLDTERTALLTELATVRSNLVSTTRDLTDEQLGERPTVSALCLGGLIKHVSAMEESWMRFIVEGTSAINYDMPDGVTWDDLFSGTATEFPQWAIDHQNGFQMLPGDTLAGIVARYEQVAAASEEIIAAIPDLSVTHPLPAAPWHKPDSVLSLRGVVLHVIVETAQHAGHADIIRESLDGQTST